MSLRLRSDRSLPDAECAPASWGDVRAPGDRRRVATLGSGRLAAAVVDGGRSRLLVCDGSTVRTAEGEPVAEPGCEVTGAWLVATAGTERLWLTAQHAGLLVCDRRAGDERWSAPAVILPAAGRALGSPCSVAHTGGWLVWYQSECRIEGAFVHRDGTAEPLGVVLDAGGDGDGDGDRVLCPSVVRVEGGFAMAYGAWPAGAVHLATSRDGQSWHKRGPILFRGSPGRPDEAAAANPVLLGTGGSRLTDLAYAGVDGAGRRSVMLARDIVLGDEPLAERPPAQSSAALRSVVRAIPAAALRVQPEPEKDAAPYLDLARGVTQIAGCSTPVFVVGQEHAKVVKFGRSASFAEREFDRRRATARFMPVPATALDYVDGRPVLVSEYVDGPTLAELAVDDADAFAAGLRRVLADSLAMWSATIAPYDPARVEFTPRTPLLLIDALERMSAPPAGSALGAPVTVNGRDLGLSLAAAARAAIPRIAEPPSWLVFANGDVNGLNHFLMSEDGVPLAIDQEFSGWFDIDFAACALYMSLLHRGRAFRDVAVAADRGRMAISYGVATAALAAILEARPFLETWAQAPVRLARVAAYTLAMLARLRRLYLGPQRSARWLDGIAQTGSALLLFDRLGVLGCGDALAAGAP